MRPSSTSLLKNHNPLERLSQSQPEEGKIVQPTSSCKHPHKGNIPTHIPTHSCLNACRRGAAAVNHPGPPPTPQATRAPTCSTCTRALTGALQGRKLAPSQNGFSGISV